MSGAVVLVLRLLLAVALYAFFVTALYFLWRQFRSGETDSQHAAGKIALTRVMEEDSPPIQFNNREVAIGRDAGNDLVLDDETVSAHHARLYFRQKQWWLDDGGSTNGTYLNGQLISGPTVVIHGDRVACGRVELELQISEASGSAAPQPKEKR